MLLVAIFISRRGHSRVLIPFHHVQKRGSPNAACKTVWAEVQTMHQKGSRNKRWKKGSNEFKWLKDILGTLSIRLDTVFRGVSSMVRMVNKIKPERLVN